MGLKLKGNNQNILFNNIILSEVDSSVKLQSDDGDVILSISVPFNLSKISPEYKDVNKTQTNFLILKNIYFNQFDVVELFVKGNKKTRQGLLFKLSIINEEDARELIQNDKILQVSILRAIIKLLRDEVSISAKTPEQRRTLDYQLSDFYDDDIIIGAFPIDWIKEFNSPYITSTMLNLYCYGFYLMKFNADYGFNPELNPYQDARYYSVSKNKSTQRKSITYKKIPNIVVDNSYFQKLIQNLIKRDHDLINKFHLLYQTIEILSDYVLKAELQLRICKSSSFEDHSGYKVKNIASEISSDSYRIGKLFSKYSNCESGADQDAGSEIILFLSDNIENFNDSKFDSFSQLIYELRNQIVHNFQFLFLGTSIEIEDRLKRKAKIVKMLEYTLVESMVNLKHHT